MDTSVNSSVFDDKVTLAKLNGDSFENIVKALAMEKFGPSGEVYPAGADAGRDFFYSGKIPGYEGKDWNGNLILQAKYKLSLRGTPDVTWLIAQLSRELKKFSDPLFAGTLPEYYIIATNINLSGADVATGTKKNKGGLTKIKEHMKRWKSEIGLKDFDIWPAEKIETFLSASPGVRTRYAAYLTPGDVIKQLLDNLSSQKKNLEQALKIYLIHTLNRDKNVRLKDAGSVGDDQIRASQVFVDLPISDGKHYPDEFERTFIREAITASKGIFNTSLISGEQSHKNRKNNKYVLLGGPGQGKSTASLFLIQTFRAALLRYDDNTQLDEATDFLISEIFERIAEEQISKAIPARYPIWISLPQFADKISKAKIASAEVPSLLSFVAAEIKNVTKVDITSSDVRNWLSVMPWIFTFDGLDEVPASGERTAVLDAIQNLIAETELLNGDVIFIATTRPQGYNSDFASDMWTHWELSDLSPPKAISYARLLAKSYYKNDEDRQQKIIEQLENSLESKSTHRLMKSPLQVTILHMIVDTGGGVPTSRWNLFNEYFDILKKREKSKGGGIQKILDKNLAQIGPIHQRVGLVLHVESESAGMATSTLTSERLKILIEKFLNSEGFDEEETQQRINELSELSLHRLVLLSSREEGRISFDVRSLQEFMAASALTASSPEYIEKRLLALAGKSHWQHVFTIAVSRCFSDDNLHYLRQIITSIPRALEATHTHKIVGNGASLALALFVDGIAADQPNHRRALAVHALELLNHGPYYTSAPLTELYEPHTARILDHELEEKYLSSNNHEIKAAAWSFIFAKNYKTGESLDSFIETHWPRNPKDAFEIFKYGVFPRSDKDFLKFLSKDIFATACSKILNKAETLTDKLRDFIDRSEFLERQKAQGYVSLTSKERQLLNIFKALFTYHTQSYFLIEKGHVGFSFTPISSLKNVVRPKHGYDFEDEWELVFAAADFSRSPTVETLNGCVISFLKIKDTSEFQVVLDRLPWVIAQTLQNKNISSLTFSDEILAGEYGTPDEWQRAEERFLTKGLITADFVYTADHSSLDKNIGTIGRPHLSTFNLMDSELSVKESILALCEHWQNATNTTEKYYLALAIEFNSIMFDSVPEFDEAQSNLIVEIIYNSNKSNQGREHLNYQVLGCLNYKKITADNIQRLAELSISTRLKIVSGSIDWTTSPDVGLLCSHLHIDASKFGLVNLICALKLTHSKCKESPPIDVLEALTTHEDASIRFSASSILLLTKNMDNSRFISCLSQIDLGEGQDDHHLNILDKILGYVDLPVSQRADLAADLIGLYKHSNKKLVPNFKTRLKALLDSELSGLTNNEVWNDLKLPADAFFSIR